MKVRVAESDDERANSDYRKFLAKRAQISEQIKMESYKLICEKVSHKYDLTINEATKTGTFSDYTFHYVYNADAIDKIKRTNSLLPVNRTRAKADLDVYASRTESNNADVYFEEMYNKFYKPVLNRPYRNYGIYTTPLDLIGIADVQYRIDIPLADIDPDQTVIQIGSNVRKFSYALWQEVTQQFADKKKVKQIYDSSKLHFKRLPQIVTFVDELPINPSNIVPLEGASEKVKQADKESKKE